MMYENLMLVDKEGYDTCTVNKKRNPSLNRLLLKCDGDAKKLRFITEKFAPQRAIQDKIKYLSGKTYYFIATSNGSKESVNNLSGGRCKTHHMKLKIKVCHDSDPCPFIQPKCPYSSVGKKTTTTTSTTLATTTTTKLNMTLPASTAKTTLQRTTSSKNRILSTTESQRQAIEMLKKRQNFADFKAEQHSSQESMWGAPRKHIIIHITMSLIILILALSLIYVSITRRKRKSKPMAFTSKLYNERPMSALPLDEDFNRDSRIDFNRDSRIDFNRDSRNDFNRDSRNV
ncbi:ephrin-B1-like isoform X2 [Xenia sp. Carnegie-2017]|nr:ephrin-B1-like isoform X2 [Xenia sp. Carnegie-2017]